MPKNKKNFNEIKEFFNKLDKLELTHEHEFFLENIIKKFFDKMYEKNLQISKELIIIASLGKNMAKAFEIFEKERLADEKTYPTYDYVAAYLKLKGLDIEKLTLHEALIIISQMLNENEIN